MEGAVGDCGQGQKGQKNSEEGVHKENKKVLGIWLGQVQDRVIWVRGGEEGKGEVSWVWMEKVGIGLEDSGLKGGVDDEGKRERQ